MKLVADKEFI